MLVACLGASIFAYQLFIVPQPASFAPNWGNAQWVQAADTQAPTAYFRHTFSLNAPPSNAFVVVAANQVFQLYVDGTYIGSNRSDFARGNVPRAYIFDVTSAIDVGVNVVGFRVANLDNTAPALRASFNIVRGNTIYRDGSGKGWLATSTSALVYPRYRLGAIPWNMATFDASSWLPVQQNTKLALTPTLQVDPLLYEHALSPQWISSGASPDAYFVRQFSLPLSYNGAWLRLAATGPADVYINGNQFFSWRGQASLVTEDLPLYLSDANSGVEQQRVGQTIGIYNISQYLHAGVNTIAVHVVEPGVSAAQVGLPTLNAAMTTDVLLSDTSGRTLWITADANWRASTHPVDNWAQVSSPVTTWPSALLIARPGAINTFYLPENVTQQNVQVVPVSLLTEIVLGALALVVGFWLLFSFGMLRRFCRSTGEALAIGSLMYLPALALEGLLFVLSREPQMPRPFPFTWLWASLLVALVWATSVLLWINSIIRHNQRMTNKKPFTTLLSSKGSRVEDGLRNFYRATSERVLAGQHTKRFGIVLWLRQNWGVVLLVIVAIPLSCYNLGYEPYWQDELSSYYAARGILAHGLPYFPSGFLYPKSELYSYILALWLTLFGQADGISRAISVVEYLLCIPLIYIVGSYFFDKRVGLLSAAMLTFSPTSLVWSRQMRMYEQEQLMALLTIFLFYKAIQKQEKVYLVYLAAVSLILTYFSHEEVFIVMPGLLLAILYASTEGKRRLPSILYQKHWWYAGLLCVSVIGIQLLIAKYSHPPTLGTDVSQQPQVGFTTDNVPFYTNLLFLPDNLGNGNYPWITLNSVLATIGCFLARRGTNMRAKYCALFLFISVLTLVFVFTATADRYMYVLYPVYYMLGSYALLRILLALWAFARPRIILQKRDATGKPVLGGSYLSRPMSLALYATGALVCLSVLVVPILPLSNYNVFVSRVTGFEYHRHYRDYDAVAAYMNAHIQPQDTVISIAPPNCTLYYDGKVDYFFSIDRALFLIEQKGTIVETASGAKAMFNQEDFQAVLSSNSRIWIVSDNGPYQSQVLSHFTLPPDFRIVYEGYGSALYFRGAS